MIVDAPSKTLIYSGYSYEFIFRRSRTLNHNTTVMKQLDLSIGNEPSLAPRPVVNVAKVRQLSPLRYPGGKTWLVPEIRRWLASLPSQPDLFIEPFAGGGIASLTAVTGNYVKRALMSELDDGVAALWQCIFEDAPWLIDRILSFKPTRDNVLSVLRAGCSNQRELAFQTLVRNRTQRGGILANGAGLMKTGENRKGVASRWYPQTLANRIEYIYAYRTKITFLHEDGFNLIAQYKSHSNAAFFVDPPYTASTKRAGLRLYNHNTIDHVRLFELMNAVKGPFMMTYDQDSRVEAMAQERGFAVTRVAMKNTHHRQMVELLISKAAPST